MYGRDGLQRTAWRRGRARKALGMAVCTLLLWPGAACGNDSAALDEAARVLATDGRKVASLPYVKNKKITDRTSKEWNNDYDCAEGTSRRSFEFTADIEIPLSRELLVESMTLQVPLRGLAYEFDGDFRSEQPGIRVTGWRKEVPGITFMLIVRSATPNIVYSGRSDCLPDGSPKIFRFP